MGLFGRRKKPVDIPPPEDWLADPQSAMRRAMDGTDTYVDEHGNRHKLTAERRAGAENLRPFETE